MERRRRGCGRRAKRFFPTESQRGREERRDGPQAASPTKRRGRERHREKGRRRASSPSICRGHEHRCERGRRRSESPITFRGLDVRRERDRPRVESPTTRHRHEYRTERDGPRGASPSPSTRRGRERYREREVHRGASPSIRRGRERHRERAQPCAASSSTRRGRERLQERQGRRDESPRTRRGREHHQEQQGRRDESPRTRRGRERHQERQGDPDEASSTHRSREHHQEWEAPGTSSESAHRVRTSSPASDWGRERHEERDVFPETSPASARDHERPRNAPADSHREHDRPQQPEGPRSALLTSDHGHTVHRERGGGPGARPSSPTSYSGQKRQRDTGSPSSHCQKDVYTSHSKHGDQKSLGERVAPVTPPVVETQRNNEYDEADEQQQNCIFRLQEVLVHEVIRRVTPTELCRMVSASRDIHRLLNRATKIEVPIPFLGALVLRERTYDVVSLMDRRMLRGIQPSVSYLRGTVRQFPAEVQIIDCRYGLMLLKFGKDEVKFCICSPFQRNSWIVLPQHDIQTDQIMAGALIHDTETGIRLVLVCLDKSAEGSYLPLVVNVFSSATRRWTRVQQLLCFRADESVLPHGVHCGRFVHFLSKTRRQILKVDPVNLTTDVINLPKKAFPEMALARVGGELYFSTAENGQILISQYRNNHWELRWTRRTPSEAYWTKIVGSADENGILIVETGSEQSHALIVRNGTWLALQHHSIGETCIGLEISSPFQFPFPQPVYELEESMPKYVKKGSLKDL